MTLCLEGVVVRFTGPDAHRVLDRRNEDLAVADLAGFRGALDRSEGLVHLGAAATTTSILILGRKLTAYSAPR